MESDNMNKGSIDKLITKYGEGEVLERFCSKCGLESEELYSAGVHEDKSGCVRVYAEDDEWSCPNCTVDEHEHLDEQSDGDFKNDTSYEPEDEDEDLCMRPVEEDHVPVEDIMLTGASRIKLKSKNKKEKLGDIVDPIVKKHCKKTKCPKCPRLVSRLRRHLIHVHKWNDCTVNFHLAESRKEKRKNPMKRCPVRKCRWWGAVLGRHLQTKHKISKQSNPTLYTKMLSSAKKVKDIISNIKAKEKEEDTAQGSDVEPDSTLPPSTKKRRTPRIPIVKASTSTAVQMSDVRCSYVLPKRTSRSSTILVESGNESWSEGEDYVDTSYDPSKHVESSSSEDEEPERYTTSRKRAAKPLSDKCADESDPQVFEDSITGFLDHLLSPDGGRKDDKVATQKQKQVIALVDAFMETGPKTMLRVWGNSDVIWKSFFEKELDKRNKWLNSRNREQLPKGLSAATLQAYSTSLEEYCGYVIHRHENITGKEQAKISTLLNVQGAWRKSLSRDKVQQESIRRSEERSKQISLDDLAVVMTSNLAKRAKARLHFGHLGIVSGTVPLYDPSEFTVLRNFIMTTLLYDLAGRASSLSGITVNEFQNRRVGDKYVKVTVANHKTSNKYGPLTLCLKRSTCQMMEVYYKLIRSKQPFAETSNGFFLTDTGSNVESNQVASCISSFVRRTESLPSTTGTCPTSIRKMWVTVGHAKDDEGFGEEGHKKLATLMMHQVKTAKTWYDQNPGREDDSTDAATLIQEAQKKAEERVERLVSSSSTDANVSPSKTGGKKLAGRAITVRWSLEENRCLKKEFSKLVLGQKRPLKKDILDIFTASDANADVAAIWNRQTEDDSQKWHDKCVDKIRTLWNTHQAKKQK